MADPSNGLGRLRAAISRVMLRPPTKTLSGEAEEPWHTDPKSTKPPRATG